MANNKQVKILIAEDSAFMRKVLVDILTAGGFNSVFEASDGKEALDIYEREKPDLVLLDLIMPNIDGMDVLKQIGFAANVMVITAVNQQKSLDKATELGAKDYIVKPFDRRQVLDKVKALL